MVFVIAIEEPLQIHILLFTLGRKWFDYIFNAYLECSNRLNFSDVRVECIEEVLLANVAFVTFINLAENM